MTLVCIGIGGLLLGGAWTLGWGSAFDPASDPDGPGRPAGRYAPAAGRRPWPAVAVIAVVGLGLLGVGIWRLLA